LGIEGGHAIEDSARLLPGFYQFDFKHLGWLRKMVDISHVSDMAFWDALAVNSSPLFASHSPCRSISSIPRNISDEMIVALAKRTESSGQLRRRVPLPEIGQHIPIQQPGGL
jgi:hypothetical protein